MKLNLSTQKVTKLNYDEIIERITSYLNQSGYIIVERTDNVIQFINNINADRASLRSDYYTRVKSGRFEIVKENNVIILRVSYQIFIFLELIFLSAIIISGLFINYKAFILIIIFFLNFLSKIHYLKSKMIEDIIGEE